MGRKLRQNVITLRIMLLGVLASACWGFVSLLTSESALEKLDLWCTKSFGNNYHRAEPSDVVVHNSSNSSRHNVALQVIEHSVERSLSADIGQNERTLERMLSRLADDPSDSTQLFRFAFACSYAATADGNQGGSFWFEGQHRYWAQALKWMLAQPANGALHEKGAESSFEWLRLYLIIDGSWGDHPPVIPRIKALLAKHTGDLQLLGVLARQLGSMDSDAETKEGLAVCKDGIAKWPRSPFFYSIASYTYETRWLRLGRRKEDAEGSIRTAEEALARMRAGSFMEAPLKQRIKTIRGLSSGHA